MHKYKFNRDGKWEDVSPEIWRWEAHYSDGTVLKQFDDDGIFHQFGEIDQSRLFAFKMVSDSNTFTLLFTPEMKLIHFYRIQRNLISNELIGKLYVFGYELKGLKQLYVITPTNELVITDDLGKVSVS